MRPLPSAEVVLSSACKRYSAPLRLPARPGSISAAPYTSPLSVPAHPAGSPVVPPGAVRACHPCYPGGPQMTWQRWGSPGRRSSPSGNGVDALTELTRLHLGSLHATACELARVPSDAFVRELGASGYPSHLPQATRARCPLPGPDFHRQVPEYPRHATGYHLGPNLVIWREHGFNSSAARPGEAGRHEGSASHGALAAPAGIAGIGLSIVARGVSRGLNDSRDSMTQGPQRTEAAGSRQEARTSRQLAAGSERHLSAVSGHRSSTRAEG